MKRFKLQDGWKFINRSLMDNNVFYFEINENLYVAYKVVDYIKVKNLISDSEKKYNSESDIKTLCQVIITSDEYREVKT